MYDVIIIGAGPAGISSGLYAKRLNKTVLILYHGHSDIEKANLIENYYGFENGINGKELYEAGIRQAKNLKIDIIKEEVFHIEKEDNIFRVSSENNEYKSKTLILANGNKKLRPDIEGIIDFENKGVSYCAICDGFFYKGKNVVVIGNGKFANSEAEILKNVANNVKILTDNQKMEIATTFEIIEKKIKEIKGDNKVRKIEFEDGTELNVDGIFVAIGEAGSMDFAKKIGILTSNENIVVDENMRN